MYPSPLFKWGFEREENNKAVFSEKGCLSDSENRARGASPLFKGESGCLSDSENRARGASPLFKGESGCLSDSENRARGIYKYRIYYEDTDAGGVVYYANYLKFFERARTDFLREKNIVQSELAKDLGIIFVVRNCLVEYLKPARMDDLIVASVQVVETRKTAIKMQQEIFKDGVVLCKLDVEIVCVDAINFKPKKIPENLINLINVR
jgi:acyl-CoA thioester hydrolase